MKHSTLSLRSHLIWILLVKLVVIVALRWAFFPSLEQQHPPSDLYLDLPGEQLEQPPLRSFHD